MPPITKAHITAIEHELDQELVGFGRALADEKLELAHAHALKTAELATKLAHKVGAYARGT